MTNFYKEPIPTWIQSFFELSGDTVIWAKTRPTVVPPRMQRKTFPLGAVAGSRLIFGRGKLVNLSKTALLTTDIRAALLSPEGDWPSGPVWDGSTSAADHALMLELAFRRFELRDGALVWAEDRGRSPETGLPAFARGSLVAGAALSGFRGRMVTTSGVGFLSGDLEHALMHCEWPWQPAEPAINWD
jgi:hypothetical protein